MLFLMFLWGCFWKRLECEPVDWVKEIHPHHSRWAPPNSWSQGKGEGGVLSLSSVREVIFCPWTWEFIVLRPSDLELSWVSRLQMGLFLVHNCIELHEPISVIKFSFLPGARGSQPWANSSQDTHYLEKKPITKKGWWSGSRCRPWDQAPTPQKKKNSFPLYISISEYMQTDT
jgi:hypothetical protein